MLDEKPSPPARTGVSLVGQTFGRYHITQKLGAGGMGVVYRAFDTTLERAVALKFLPDNLAVTSGDRTNLRREARAASTLDHPNVGVVHGLEEMAGNHLFIVMQFYEGETLARRLSRSPIPLPEGLELAIQIARGLSAAHAANIVHRDVKPSNIIISKSGVAKIVDFGLARIVASASATQTISATGTLPYMAPEQILCESVDQRSDVWALGVILVQMITGNHPFVRPSTTAMTFAILNQPPGALDLVPAPLSSILYRALAKKPEHRYANAAEMLSDLEASRQEILALPAQPSGPTHTHDVTPRELRQFMQHASTPMWTTTRGSQATRWLALASLAIILAAAVALLLPPSRERLAGLAYSTTVVEGSLSRNGPDVSLTVVLIDSKRLRQIGSAQIDNPSGDLAALQNQAVFRLASMMKVSSQGVSPANRTAVAPTAYEAYLKALGYLQRYDKPGNPALAISELDSAVAETPSFALGYATLGEAYRLKFLMDHDPAAIEAAFANCRKAIGIDSQLPSAHVTLGLLQSALGKHHLALEEFQKVLAINSHDADALIGTARVYEQMGRATDAEANLKHAIALRPDYWDGYRALAEFYDRQKRSQDAILQYRRIIELTPDNPEAYSDLGVQYMQLADAESSVAAEDALRKSIQLAPNYQAYANLGWLYLQQKRYDESVASTRKALEFNDRDWRVWSNLQLAYTWLQDQPQLRAARARTLSLLEQYAAVNPNDALIPQRSICPRRHRRDPSRPRRPPPRPPICPPKPGKRVHSVRPAAAARARSARRSGCGESSSRLAIGLDWFLGPAEPGKPWT